MPTDPDDLELSDSEAAALHDLQLGIEYVYRRTAPYSSSTTNSDTRWAE